MLRRRDLELPATLTPASTTYIGYRIKFKGVCKFTASRPRGFPRTPMEMRAVVFVVIGLLMSACASEVPGGRSLEDRLLAPCCFRQTLADHESPLATQLRAEVRARISRGEVPSVIEQDLVARYGTEILAQGDGQDRRWMIGVGAAAAVLAGLAIVLAVLRRHLATPVAALDGLAAADERYADQLDDELATQLD